MFIWAAKRLEVILLYLPACYSHVLQPLDLVGFNVVNGKYYREINDLAMLNDDALIKKCRFIYYYDKACRDDLTPTVTRAGWRAKGLHPFRSKIAIESSQVSTHPAIPPPAALP